MFSINHAKFHASITKVNNSALFWTLAARLQRYKILNKLPRKIGIGGGATFMCSG